MNGPRRYYAEWNKSGRERLIEYDVTHTWKLKNKIHKTETDSDAENRLMAEREEWAQGLGEKGEGIQKDRLVVTEQSWR